MFAKPRPKKSILPPPSKKRKTTSAVEEVNFDLDARQEYLTGFHKRKQQRIKLAQEENAKRAHQEKLEMRKQARENRRREVEEHVQAVNQILRESRAAGGEVEESEEESAEEWDGIPDQPDLQIIDQEEEYIDEDRYTTVTVETVAVSKDGLFKPQVLDAEEEEEERSKKEAQEATKQAAADAIRNRTEKKKKKKFRYESKIERQLTERKSKSKKAKARASRVE